MKAFFLTNAVIFFACISLGFYLHPGSARCLRQSLGAEAQDDAKCFPGSDN